MDIEALTKKVVTLLPNSEETILASSLLVAARHLLRQPTSPVVPTQVSLPIPSVPSPVLPMPVAVTNPGQLDVNAVAQAILARMSVGQGQQAVVGVDQQENGQPQQQSLIQKWAGPVPTLNVANAPGRGGVRRKKRSPDIPVVKPTSRCSNCGDPISYHPKDKNSPQDAEGRDIFILCGGRRVRCLNVEVPSEE